ncbi:MAG TPA: hypothetical protein VFD85_10870 [Gemmatimonadales bacterium]|nr:hypothetical protein [Gemmatimonadales bacterium]
MRRVLVALSVIPFAVIHAQGMAPVDQYRMDRAAEIALAKSAAPAAISEDADVLVMGAAGYETAVKGKNGFVCVVERGWATDYGNPDFWNPQVRSPFCYNALGARSVLADYLARTRQALSGMSEAKMEAAKPPLKLENGAMAYMLSKDGYLGGDVKGPWHPHVMVFMPHMSAASLGANVEHSPAVVNDSPTSRITVFVIPVARWSDGTADSAP